MHGHTIVKKILKRSLKIFLRNARNKLIDCVAKSCSSCSKEIGIEMNADKTKFTVMSRDQHAGRSHNMRKLKQSRNRPGVAKRVPGGLGSKSSMTFGS